MGRPLVLTPAERWISYSAALDGGLYLVEPPQIGGNLEGRVLPIAGLG
jgi:hypothetical protein